jgi:6,7-dimethyl-8-ribityllumazine synthase
MLASARAEFEAGGVEPGDVLEAWVPGSFDLPLVARRFARRDDIDAVICFGLILKGETTHDHWVAAGATHGIVQASLETDTPILLGVLTCQNLEQARARALPVDQGGHEDKGRELARAALSILHALDVADGVADAGAPTEPQTGA